MSTERYTIASGDFESAGLASRKLKEHLKRIGVQPKAIRRAVIASYEAEMNVVIYARGGVMEVTFLPGCIDLVVQDEGPGIPDIPRAMIEGFSTAPAEIRAMGFGAGMGLPNIQRNSDHFSISSEPGVGTRLHFTIRFEPERIGRGARHSIALTPARCKLCLRCLAACPTTATRVRADGPQILEHLCIDCTSCIEACEPSALSLAGIAEVPTPAPHSILILPPPLLFQFGMTVSPHAVLEWLERAGFKHVRLVSDWEAALREAVLDAARSSKSPRPLISPVCPPVVNLIETRFPSLLEHLAPWASPYEAASSELDGSHLMFTISCPGQKTCLETQTSRGKVDIISASTLVQQLLPAAARTSAAAAPDIRWGERTPELAQEILAVSGLSHVIEVLDGIENGRLKDIPVVELYACDQGCFGSPLYRENAFVAAQRSTRAGALGQASALAMPSATPRSPRSGMRLDSDMMAAVRKLSEIDRLTRELPGRDCGACGSPSCTALAEDVVLGRVPLSACVYLASHPEKTP